eukprot:6080549-Pyramimonas_sp.AAC.1
MHHHRHSLCRLPGSTAYADHATPPIRRNHSTPPRSAQQADPTARYSTTRHHHIRNTSTPPYSTQEIDTFFGLAPTPAPTLRDAAERNVEGDVRQ